MAHRKGRSRAGGFRGLQGKLMTGFFKVPIADQAAKGLGYATLLRRFVNIHPLQDEAVALATGGAPGAIAVFALKNVATNTATTGSAGIFNY